MAMDQLSTEILLNIFKRLNPIDLCHLKQTCKRFYDVVETFGGDLIDARPILVASQINEHINKRTWGLLSPFERLRVSRNWQRGHYDEKYLLYSRIKYIPWLELKQDLLWLSRGGFVRSYNRTNNGVYSREVVHELGRSGSDVCRFVVKNDQVLSGLTNGGIWLWCKNRKKVVLNQDNCHRADINAIDMTENVIVTGSRDERARIWAMPDLIYSEDDDANKAALVDTLHLRDRVWALSFCDFSRNKLAIGTSGTEIATTLRVWDMGPGRFLDQFGSQYGAGIFDIKWESQSVVWAGGYDSNVKRFDLRTSRCEQILEDPFQSSIYCFEFDHNNSIVTGTQNHGRAVLWDIRNSKRYVQMYFMNMCKARGGNSPIYSLSFDSRFLFTSTDRYLNILDFATGRLIARNKNNSRDYSNLFRQK